MLDLDAVRARFPALSRVGDDGRPLVLVDAPGGSQVPDDVIEAVSRHYRRGMSNTHGAFATSQETDDVIADARRAAADFTGADPDEIVFGPNATTLLLHVSRSFAKTLAPGDEVVVTRLDHDANVRPWVLAAADAGATVRWVDVREDDVTIDVESFEAALSPRTKLVAFTLASNAVGTIPPARGPRGASERRRRSRRGGRRASRAASPPRSPRDRRRPPRVLPVQVLRTPSRNPGGAPEPPRVVVAVQARTVVGRCPRAVGDRHPEPRGSRRTFGGGDYLAGLSGGTDASRRDRLAASYAAITGHEQALADRFLAGMASLPSVRLWGISDRTAPPSARPRSRSGSATSIRPRRRRPWRRAASSSGTATTTLARSWSGSVSSRPAARCASGSATTTRRTRWTGCWTPSASSASDIGVRSRGPSGR